MRRARFLLPTLALLTLLAVLSAHLPLCLALSAGQWVAVDQAPVRVGASAEAEVLLRLARGGVVSPLYDSAVNGPAGGNGSWVRVRVADGREGWMFRGHLSAEAPPPALADFFAPPPPSLILAEQAESARSSRALPTAQTDPAPELAAVLGRKISPEELEDFLRQGGVGEFAPAANAAANAPGAAHGAAHGTAHGTAFGPQQAAYPDFHPASAPGGEQETQFGVALAARAFSRMAPASPEADLARYVTLVGMAVARYAPGRQMPLRVALLDLQEPVSFSLPGGLVMVSVGLVRALENEAQLAGVLAHEAAHASLGHLWAEAEGSALLKRGGKIDAAGMAGPEYEALLLTASDTALVHGLPTDQEREADLAAACMLHRAGYDPRQWPQAMAAIAEAERRLHRALPPMGWTALHPPLRERTAAVERLIVTWPGGLGLAVNSQRFRQAVSR